MSRSGKGNWHIYTYFLGKECKLFEDLNNTKNLGIIEQFIPCYDEQTIKVIQKDIRVNNKTFKLMERQKLFENYLFVKLEKDNHEDLLDIENIVQYLGRAKRGEIEKVKVFLDLEDIKIEENKSKFNVGDEVIVKQNGFECIKGKIVDPDIGNGYAKILPPFFQKIIKVKLNELDYAN